jgi:5-(carboxyamino)imidazole ribonucleotide synthase
VKRVRLGIVGGGQLARMIALAAAPLGISCTALDPALDSPASQVCSSLVALFDDLEALARLAESCDVVTFEFENVPAEAVSFIEERVAVHPTARALAVSQDRLAEKSLFDEIGLPVAEYVAVDDAESLRSAVAAIGLPALLKSRRLGYDGKGQALIQHAELAEEAWRAIGEVPSILEAYVGFNRELSIVGVRGSDGRTGFYPLVENVHRDGILRTTRAPAPSLTPELQHQAETHATAIMDRLDYVGVLAIELFHVDGTLLGNEVAPRVHNSGHWTIEGAQTSQFENHVRAVMDLPLGSCEPLGPTAMVNLIGAEPEAADILSIEGAHLHTYGKDARPGRKLGHVTVRAENVETLERRLASVLTIVA